MKKISVKMAVIAIVLIIACFIYRVALGSTMTFSRPNPGFETQGQWADPPASLITDFDTEGIVKIEKIRTKGQQLDIRFKALSPGDTTAGFTMEGESDLFFTCSLSVDRFLTITVDGLFFAGEECILYAAGIFLLVTCFLFLQYFLSLKGGDLYSYLAIFSVGMALFTGAGAIGIIFSIIHYLIDPYGYGIYSAITALSRTASSCMFYMTIPMLIFAIAMIVSNIELLRHERLRFANILGIIIPVSMILGEALLVFLDGMFFMGSFEEYRVRAIIIEVLTTIYVYFECMLAGSVICGIRSVKHKVPFDRDYIIILGCKFRADGSLTPLLQGRCDRAISFWKEQKKTTGKDAILMPSGGQGPDESMPEAEAMARYLLSQGVPESSIVREQESKNTYQNMEFSKKLIDAKNPRAKVAYATTNYHVFRSGLWASLAGLNAEGLGGVTKWWFWPNAFMRECVGLMANRVRQEAILLVRTIIICIFLSYLTIN